MGRFMVKHLTGLLATPTPEDAAADEPERSEEAVLKKIKDTFHLIVFSCVQLASKLSLHSHMIDNNTAVHFLRSVGLSVSKQILLESELMVLKGLEFRLDAPNPLTYVEILLEVLGHNEPSIPVERLHLLCHQVLQFVSLQRTAVYDSLLVMTTRCVSPSREQRPCGRPAALRLTMGLCADCYVSAARRSSSRATVVDLLWRTLLPGYAIRPIPSMIRELRLSSSLPTVGLDAAALNGAGVIFRVARSSYFGPTGNVRAGRVNWIEEAARSAALPQTRYRSRSRSRGGADASTYLTLHSLLSDIWSFSTGSYVVMRNNAAACRESATSNEFMMGTFLTSSYHGAFDEMKIVEVLCWGRRDRGGPEAFICNVEPQSVVEVKMTHALRIQKPCGQRGIMHSGTGWRFEYLVPAVRIAVKQACCAGRFLALRFSTNHHLPGRQLPDLCDPSSFGKAVDLMSLLERDRDCGSAPGNVASLPSKPDLETCLLSTHDEQLVSAAKGTVALAGCREVCGVTVAGSRMQLWPSGFDQSDAAGCKSPLGAGEDDDERVISVVEGDVKKTVAPQWGCVGEADNTYSLFPFADAGEAQPSNVDQREARSKGRLICRRVTFSERREGVEMTPRGSIHRLNPSVDGFLD
ncbi:Cyclin N-terminal domain-containing protein 1 [Liparis tanakae]|uniref:Cyclin N-terminal domain-containing protein 1 n=1 Tax=Liparis tanakae TaxID=230148 RepID=A0A4Z2J5C2_9TELE|nr:Cyclin N-terminal domain-containing protein 1 [Liparis tanakae]